MHVRICPECGEEYRPEIARCADCDVVLEDADDEDGARTRPSVAEPAPAAIPEGFQPIFWCGQARDLAPLTECLLTAGLAFHVHAERGDPHRASTRFALLVSDDARTRALEALAPFLDAHVDPGLLQRVEREFEAGSGYRSCPACGVALGESAAECPECGLAIAMEPPSCPECGAEVSQDEACPECGFSRRQE